MVDSDRRAQVAKLRALQTGFPKLDQLGEGNEYFVGRVAIVGASNASGFGANLGRAILDSNPDNSVVLTGRGKKLDFLRRASESHPYDPRRTEVVEFDVTNPVQTGLQVDHLVVCPAYMDPKFLKRGVRFEDIPQEELERSRAVTVDGFLNAAQSFDVKKGIWGVSFAGHDFPGYNIGPIKQELEEMIVLGGRILPGVRQNVFSLGVFESVAGLGIEGFEDASRIYDAIGITNPTLSEMVYGAVTALHNSTNENGFDKSIVDLDGGLRTAIISKEKGMIYSEFCKSLRK